MTDVAALKTLGQAYFLRKDEFYFLPSSICQARGLSRNAFNHTVTVARKQLPESVKYKKNATM